MPAAPWAVPDVCTALAAAAVVWPASQSLASLFTHCPSFVKDCRVLEIGCGLGTVGIAAAMAGAASVLLTDLDEGVLTAAAASADLNGVGSRVRTAPLDVAEYDLTQGALAAFGPFDLIVGSCVEQSTGSDTLRGRPVPPQCRSSGKSSPGRREPRPASASLGHSGGLEAAG